MGFHTLCDDFRCRVEHWRAVGLVCFLSLILFATLVTPANAADAVISEKQARRAAQVTILKMQFRQQGGFASDQLSGFYTALQLSNEINNDLKRGIARDADYYRKRSLSINDYFHEQVLSRPTLLTQTDAALV